MGGEAVPIECGAGIDFVSLNVVVADEALVVIELGVGDFDAEEIALLIARVITFDFREGFAKGGGEFDQGGVLLGGEVVLDEVAVLDFPVNWCGTGGPGYEIGGADAGGLEFGRDGDACTFFIGGVPAVEDLGAPGRIGADVCDFDADRAGV